MWYLVSLHNPDEKTILLTGRAYVVGRRDCDILITGDPAVSRKHAVLQLSHSEANVSHPSKYAVVKLQDTSKFGTFVNDKKLDGETILKDGDEIMFGSVSKFMVSCEPLVVTASCLDGASKKQLRTLLVTLGGHLVSEWTRDCSLLVMSHISVTIKVIAALIAQKHIVTPKYFEDLLLCHQGSGTTPDPADYEPSINEPQLNDVEISFKPNPDRAKLFQGMKFFFLNAKQFKKLSNCVSCAGAMPVLLDVKNDDFSDDMLVAPGAVVMNCSPEDLEAALPDSQKHIRHVQALLKRKKKFFIQDADIGLAVLFCSMEKHCNPDLDTVEHVAQFLQTQSLSQSAANMLVSDTPSQHLTKQTAGARGSGNSSSVVIGDSLASKVKEEASSPKSLKSQKKRSDMPQTVPSENQGDKETPMVAQAARVSKTSATEAGPTHPRSPAGKHQTSGAGPDLPSSSKRQRRSPSPSPSASGPASKRLRELSSSDDEDDAFGKARRRRMERRGVGDKSSVSISASRQAPSRVEKLKTVKTEPFDVDVDIEAVKSPGKRKGRMEINNLDSDEEDLFPMSKRSRQQLSDDDDDLFPRSRSKRTRPREDDDEDDDLFPMSRKSREAHSANKVKEEVLESEEEAGDITDCSRQVPSTHPQTRPGDAGRSSKESALDRNDDRRGTGSQGHQNRGQERDAELRDNLSGARIRGTEGSQLQELDAEPASVTAGFLSARKSIQNQVEKCSRFEPETSVPEETVVVTFADLVVPSHDPDAEPAVQENGDVPDGFCRYKGQLVRNFKNFSKVLHAGANALPCIIGGRDLEVHGGTHRKELDDWFQHARQEESQRQQEEEEVSELFNFQAGRARKKHLH